MATETRTFDIIIIGAGPAGLAAGLYAGRNMENAVLVEEKVSARIAPSDGQGCQRRLPTGGAANGTPRNTRIP